MASLMITNGVLDVDELKYYEDIYITDDNITVESKQLPAYTIVDNTYYTGETTEGYRVNARIKCQLGNPEGMQRHMTAGDKVLNPMIFNGNVLWTYEKIGMFDTVAESKSFIESYINEDATKLINERQHDV